MNVKVTINPEANENSWVEISDPSHLGAKPLVSVAMLTYNHEKYIEEAINSVLMQETDFEVELIISNDNSPDQTDTIIQRILKKHPKRHWIKYIKHEKNIGMMPNLIDSFQRCSGEYIAICEGDDYWLDNKKLQKQINLMLNQPEVTFTSHACYIHNQNGLSEVAYVKSPETIVVTCNDVLTASGQFAPTASYLFKSEVVNRLPSWFSDAPVGDFFIEMYAIVSGTGVHMPEIMSAYRTASCNSWTTQYNERQSSNLVQFSEKMAFCLMQMKTDPNFTNFDFSRKFAAAYFNIAIGSLLLKDFSKFQKAISDCYSSFPKLSSTQMFLYYLKRVPLIAYGLYKLKRYFR